MKWLLASAVVVALVLAAGAVQPVVPPPPLPMHVAVAQVHVQVAAQPSAWTLDLRTGRVTPLLDPFETALRVR